MAKQTTREQFELFKKSFLECVEKWKITGWGLYFKHEKINNAMACIRLYLIDKVATVSFNLCPQKDAEPFFSDQEIIKYARHEAVHLLLGRLSEIAGSRFVTQEEFKEADEEITNHLENILP